MNGLIEAGLMTLVLALSMTTPVVAGSFEDGVAAYQRGDYGAALGLWKPLAEQGDASAQKNLGDMYRFGQGVPWDNIEAVKWFRKAADQGLAQAQDSLGYMYQFGHGLDKDYAEAFRWYHKAAVQGLSEAQTQLGFAYANGRGVPRDDVEAVKWFRKAADQGNLLAQSSLIEIFSKNGWGTP